MNVVVVAEFSNPQTGEYMRVEVNFKFVEPKNLAVIKFESACRQLAKWPIMVANPLAKTVKFTCTSTVPDIFFQPNGASFDVPANSQVSYPYSEFDVGASLAYPFALGVTL